MYQRNGTDTLIGFIPGADIDEGTGAVVGGYALTAPALKTLNQWDGLPIVGQYTYPAGGTNENWDFQKEHGATGPVNFKAFAIPQGYTIAQVKSGACDAIWTQRAQYMVAQGLGQGIYQPGYEGSDKNFSGSAGQVVDASTVGSVVVNGNHVLGAPNWAYAISRQIHVMRQVAGWDCWFDVNYDTRQAAGNGLDPDPFHLITESFQSLGCEIYPYDDFSGTWSGSNPSDHARLMTYVTSHMTGQKVLADKYGVPLMFGEFGPMINPNGHTSGDDPVFVKLVADWCKDVNNNVFCLMLYNGTTGDTSRVFLWNQSTKTYTVDTTKFPLSAAAIKANLDPADFINRTAPTGTTYTQAQLDAAVAAQKAQDAASSNAGALATLQASFDTQHALLTSTQTELAEAYAQIQKTKDDWATFWSNFAGPPAGH